MTRIAFILTGLITATGCVISVEDDTRRDRHPEVAVVYNVAPTVWDGEAGCYWDSYYGDDIWYFEADVDDADGPGDIVSVWADVYDEGHGGAYVESFELYPTNDPYIWFSDWMGSSTWLDCWYGGYTVDLIAYDSFDDYDYLTVWADTY